MNSSDLIASDEYAVNAALNGACKAVRLTVDNVWHFTLYVYPDTALLSAAMSDLRIAYETLGETIKRMEGFGG